MRMLVNHERCGLLLLLGTIMYTPTSVAHHSLVSEFDVEHEFELRGTITKVDWFNPHVWIYLDMVNAQGQTEQWRCEMGSPNQVIRSGWKKENLPNGTVIRAKAHRARNGSHTCSTRDITLDSGKPTLPTVSNSAL
jgi:hypothetical protein